MKVYCSGVWGFFQMELFVKFVIQFIFAVFLQFVFLYFLPLFGVNTSCLLCTLGGLSVRCGGEQKNFVIKRFRELVKVVCKLHFLVYYKFNALTFITFLIDIHIDGLFP